MTPPTVTLKDVAQRAGVSRSAASRTFTKGASVSSKTREKVTRAATELGYRPNFLARALSTRRTQLIGLVSNNFHNPMFLEIFDLFTKGLQDRGLRPLLVNLSDETEPENSVRMLQQYSVDGVVVASSTLPSVFAKAFRDAGMPVVHAFGRNAKEPAVHVVGIDNILCGRMAARCLIERGYSRIGFMGGPQAATSTLDRLNGFRAECSAENINVTQSFASAYTFEAGRTEMLRLLRSNPAEAYFCGDDVLSIGAMSAVQSCGLNIPEDVGIIGLNDMEMAGWQNINLTTIRQPIDRIVKTSIELMIGSLNNPHSPPEVRMHSCELIERGTLKARA